MAGTANKSGSGPGRGRWKDNVHFVLVEPAVPGNIGASARAIKNMGFGRLRLVRPPKTITAEAAWLARGALDVLEAARSYETLAAALAGMSLVVGTTRRKGKKRGLAFPVKEGAARIAQVARNGHVAVLFGRESRGLFNEEAEECDFMLTIPTGGGQPSLNLSHAVLITAYELSLAEAEPEAPPLLTPLSTHERQGLLYERLLAVLDSLGYGERGDRDLKKKVFLGIRRLLGRSALTEQEMKMLLGLCTRIEKMLK